jgi:hypothetical protein
VRYWEIAILRTAWVVLCSICLMEAPGRFHFLDTSEDFKKKLSNRAILQGPGHAVKNGDAWYIK